MSMLQEFPDQAALAEALARYVAAALAVRIAQDGAACLAVSGGATPRLFFQALSQKLLDWSAVTVVPVDDRWVAESSPRSNAALIRSHLLQGPASAAKFLSLVNAAASPEAGRHEAELAVARLPLPFAAVILGMGADGHTASFFPGGDRLADALAPKLTNRVETMRAETAVEARVTLTLPVLLEADRVAIHIEGAEKRRVLEAAQSNGSILAMPVRAVLARDPAPDIFWSP
jgi:6-phosphogluconolactonase